MADVFNRFRAKLDSPYFEAVAVTPADSDLAQVTRGVYVGGAGNLAVEMLGVGLGSENGNVVVFTAVPAGTLLPIRCTQIRSTDTTATAIVALY